MEYPDLPHRWKRVQSYVKLGSMDGQLLIFEDEEFHLDNWRAEIAGLADELSALSRHSRKNQDEVSKVNWELGDCFLRAKEKGGLTDAQFQTEVTNVFKKMAQKTMLDYIRVAKRFRDKSRRRELLYWSHHKEVATAELSDSDQDKLLDLAEKDGLSVAKMRKEIRQQQKLEKTQRKRAAKDLKVATKSVEIEISAENFKLVKKLSYARGAGAYSTYKALLSGMVAKYIQDNRDSITKEVDEWWARVSKGREADKARQEADKADMEAVKQYKEKVRPLGKHFRELLEKTGVNAVPYFTTYVKKEWGVGISDIPAEVLQEMLTALKNVGEPEAQVAWLKAMSERPSPNGTTTKSQ